MIIKRSSALQRGALPVTALLALGWLVPNHYPPWLSFHADAWTACVMLAVSALVLLGLRAPVPLYRMTAFLLALVAVPWLQYASGLILQPGLAWITSAFLLGLLLAFTTGACWETQAPGQLGDGLFLAIGLAALVSVGLQWQQWLGLDGMALWTMVGDPARPSGNLGQPNQLGTLLLWGVLATAWGLLRRHLGAKVAVLLCLFLLFGVALTGSRAAWVGVGLLLLASWWWRGLWPSPKVPWFATGLALYFAVCVLAQGWLHQVLTGADSAASLGDVTRFGGELRPQVWAALWDAALLRPWFGYGWGQVAMAHMAVAADHPHLHHVFSYAHNLLLDLVLWCGIPVGLGVGGALAWWFWRRLRAVQSAEDAVLMLVLLVIANHAMVELPLYFGYFLLPTGWVMGAANARLGTRPLATVPRALGAGVWVVAALLLGLLLRDYVRVESSYQVMRLEWQRFKTTRPMQLPDVLLLTQWRDYLQVARLEPAAGMDPDVLARLEAAVVVHPNALMFQKLATSLALNHRPQDAQLWLRRMCKVVPVAQCLAQKERWARQALLEPALAAIPWPADAAD